MTNKKLWILLWLCAVCFLRGAMTPPSVRAHGAEASAVRSQPAGQAEVPAAGERGRAAEDKVYRDEPTGVVGEAISLSSLGKAAIGIRVEQVVKTQLPFQIYTTGKIEPIPTREFFQYALVTGRVKEVRVALGDAVKAGQVLVLLDSPEINQLAADTIQNKESIEADMKQQAAAMDAEIKQAQAQVDLWTSAHNRDKNLYAEGIAPRAQLEKSLSELINAQARLSSVVRTKEITQRALATKLKVSVDSMTHRLRQLGVKEGAIKEMLNQRHTVLTVPIATARSGVVTDIKTSVGSAIDPNDVLFRISDLTRVWATADIYEDDIAQVKLGEKVSVRLAAYPDETFFGHLTFIGREIDPVTRTLPVRIEIANPELKLKPDMYADLTIETREPKLTIIVPKEAVIQKTGHSLVFLATKGGYQACRVKVGRSLGDNVEILAGLVPGQNVVVRGAFQLDAELLKAHGDRSMFAQPTEGQELAEHDEERSAAPAGISLPPQIIAVIVTTAFLLGFVVSALVVRSAAAKQRPGRGSRIPIDEETISKG